ncbi:MAG: hypothetical protein HDR04_18705 [Lachnospiraceae bacterium]|nr:hypothetical protein [Lachnospiraceae bacterium]
MYQKEIIYIGLYKEGIRMGSAGFVKVESRDKDSRLYLKIQNIPHNINGRFPIRVYNGSGWKELNGITIQEGGGTWKDDLADQTDHTMIQVMLPGGYLLEGKSRFAAEAREHIEAQGETIIQKETMLQQRTAAQRNIEPRDRAITREDMESANKAVTQRDMESANKAVTQRDKEPENKAITRRDMEPRDKAFTRRNMELENNAMTQGDIEPENSMNIHRDMKFENESIPQKDMEQPIREEQLRYANTPTKVIVTEELSRRTAKENESEQENIPIYPVKEDKWEQILDTYEKIHPYGDERVYVKIEPKDFVILQSKYQHLVNNSFLLHGFYNYRYIILGREQDYYLGVPGVFYEREKMVALMFGFEAFECPGGNVRAGEFGYYLRKVEL